MTNKTIIKILDDDPWIPSWEISEELEKHFPGRDVFDLVLAISYNSPKELNLRDLANLTHLTLVQQGENDGANWSWDLKLSDGRDFNVTGGCDYTGWDCQSWVEVTPCD